MKSLLDRKNISLDKETQSDWKTDVPSMKNVQENLTTSHYFGHPLEPNINF